MGALVLLSIFHESFHSRIQRVKDFGFFTCKILIKSIVCGVILKVERLKYEVS